MFSKSEIQQFNDKYFVVLSSSKNAYEIKSRNTQHCWIIERYGKGGNVHTQHKYRSYVKKYHSQCNSASVSSAIKKIKQHDRYMLKQPHH